MTEPDQLNILRQYAAGQLGTRDAIARAGLQDYADLIIELVRHDLALPKPADTPRHRRLCHLNRVVAAPKPRKWPPAARR